MKTFKQTLTESFFDSESLADEALLLAQNNYPNEYGKRDVAGLLNKLKFDLMKQAQGELRDEMDDVLAYVKKELTAYWKREDKLK